MLILALAAALSASSAAAAEPRTLTLDQAYAAALKRSETVAEQGATYAQLMAQIDEMWAAVKPRLTLTGSHFWEDTPGPNVNFPLPANQDTVTIVGHQPIFAGLRDFLAVRAARDTGESAQLALLRAKQLLYQDVAKAYLDLLLSHRGIATRQAQIKLDDDRVKELRNFVDIGRSRRSEVLAAQTQQAQDAADLATAVGQERFQQATLRFLTGLDGDLQPAEVAVSSEAADLADYLRRADHRPDVEAARLDLDASDLNVTIQHRQYWPTVALDGDYYLHRPQTFTRFVHWDATLSASLPIYTGGLVAAQVREAKAQREYRVQALSLAQRQASLDTAQAHSDLVSDLTVVSALRDALELAQANSKAQIVDYRHGLVTNIDVLTSLTTVQSTRLRLDQAELQVYDDRVRLEVAAGGPGSVK